MKRFILLTVFVFSGVIVTIAQQPPTPQSTPVPQRTPSLEEERRRMNIQRQELERSREILGELEREAEDARVNSNQAAAVQYIRNIYRKPTRDEAKLLAPDKEEQKKYAQFLRQPGTGLVKLAVDRGCSENSQVVNISEDCRKYSMPGAGASFSFRTENHRIPHLADLTYINNSFQSSGVLAHAILVNLGDIDLEQVSLQTAGLKFINDFVPSTDFDKAGEIDAKLVSGVKSEGFFYSRRLPVAENATYVLRSIAYRGNLYRSVQGLVYDELGFDERRDVTIVFRVLRRDDHSVMILWKKLAERKSPFIKRVNQKPEKLEENKFVGIKFDHKNK